MNIQCSFPAALYTALSLLLVLQAAAQDSTPPAAPSSLRLAGSPPSAGGTCSNNKDDDGDGHIDAADEQCQRFPYIEYANKANGSLVGGWTVYGPSADTRIVYVSAQGSDSYDGLSPQRPKKQLPQAKR